MVFSDDRIRLHHHRLRYPSPSLQGGDEGFSENFENIIQLTTITSFRFLYWCFLTISCFWWENRMNYKFHDLVKILGSIPKFPRMMHFIVSFSISRRSYQQQVLVPLLWILLELIIEFVAICSNLMVSNFRSHQSNSRAYPKIWEFVPGSYLPAGPFPEPAPSWSSAGDAMAMALKLINANSSRRLNKRRGVILNDGMKYSKIIQSFLWNIYWSNNTG